MDLRIFSLPDSTPNFITLQLADFKSAASSSSKNLKWALTTKGISQSLFIFPAKFFYICLVKCKYIVIENECVDPLIILQQKFYLIDYLVDPKPPYIIKLFKGTFKVSLCTRRPFYD